MGTWRPLLRFVSTEAVADAPAPNAEAGVELLIGLRASQTAGVRVDEGAEVEMPVSSPEADTSDVESPNPCVTARRWRCRIVRDPSFVSISSATSFAPENEAVRRFLGETVEAECECVEGSDEGSIS